MSKENIIIICLSSVIILLFIILFVVLKKFEKNVEEKINEQNSQLRQELLNNTSNSIKNMSEMISSNQILFSNSQHQQLQAMNSTIDQKLNMLTQENNQRLAEMRTLVDEKLQKNLDERVQKSYSIVASQLEQVHKGLGEMQSLATGVGDLKRVLTNVKTRGILGEVQLSIILKDFLNSDMYDENVETVKGSGNRVEFAIRLPSEDDSFIWLPVDSKFPADSWQTLSDASEKGNRALLDNATKIFVSTIKKEAKDIHDKYIALPATTDFAIMFIPVESIYQEVLSLGLADVLQKEYKVTVASPTTMAGLLNSLQMGFKTLAVSKRSQEVWNLLSEVRTEFDRFADALYATQQKMEQTSGELEKLVGVRTRVMRKKLASLEDNPLIGIEEKND